MEWHRGQREQYVPRSGSQTRLHRFEESKSNVKESSQTTSLNRTTRFRPHPDLISLAGPLHCAFLCLLLSAPTEIPSPLGEPTYLLCLLNICWLVITTSEDCHTLSSETKETYLSDSALNSPTSSTGLKIKYRRLGKYLMNKEILPIADTQFPKVQMNDCRPRRDTAI